jgi:hypothetical protein
MSDPDAHCEHCGRRAKRTESKACAAIRPAGTCASSNPLARPSSAHVMTRTPRKRESAAVFKSSSKWTSVVLELFVRQRGDPAEVLRSTLPRANTEAEIRLVESCGPSATLHSLNRWRFRGASARGPAARVAAPRVSGPHQWDRSDSNREPRDYAYHFGFRRPFRVRGLDHTFTLRVCRLVSTPSAAGRLLIGRISNPSGRFGKPSYFRHRQLGSGSACLGERSVPRVWQILPWSSAAKTAATHWARPCSGLFRSRPSSPLL